MDLTVVSICLNSERTLDRCIRSVLFAFDKLNLRGEFYLVDNGSTDSSSSVIRDHANADPRIRPIYLDVNNGTTKSRNLALSQACGKLILVLDTDAYIEPASLKHLIDVLNRNNTIGIVAPKLVFPDGRTQMSTDQFPTVLRKLQRLFSLRAIERQCVPSKGPVEYAISACWLFPREILNEVGLLDEKIFYAPEDVDFCLRVWKCGLSVVYDNEVSVVHDAQERSRGGIPNKFFFLHVTGLAYYFFKHQYVFLRPKVVGKVRGVDVTPRLSSPEKR